MEEDEKRLLNEKMLLLIENLKNHPKVKITYFQEDERKEGGAYLFAEEPIKKIDMYNRRMIFVDGLNIRLDDIYDISGDI